MPPVESLQPPVQVEAAAAPAADTAPAAAASAAGATVVQAMQFMQDPSLAGASPCQTQDQHKVAQPSASWLSGGFFQSQIMPQACFSARACLGLLRTSASLGLLAAWAALWPAT